MPTERTPEEMPSRSKKDYREENAQLKKRIKELEKALSFSRLETEARDLLITRAEECFDHRQRPEECHTNLVRTVKELPSHGKAATGKESGEGGRHGHKAAFPYRKNVLTITMDDGSEFACHKKIAKALATTVYSADSYVSWQKGAIENQNKLARQYIPKGTDFNVSSV